MKHFPKYTWVGNRITPDCMAAMCRIRQESKMPITVQVAEAVKMYVEKGKEKGAAVTAPNNETLPTQIR